MTAIEVAQKAHASLGASNAKRWRNCPGSVRLIATLPERGSGDNEHSRAGTSAHALMELCLTRAVEPEMYEGMTLEGVEVDAEMVEYTRPMIQYCRDLMPGNEWFVEVRFNLNPLNPPVPMYGTCDFMAYDPINCILHIVDFKSGSGVMVDAVDNDQLQYYALGASLDPRLAGKRIGKVVLTIVQPRGFHEQGPIRTDELTFEELVTFGMTLMEDANATTAPDAPLHAGAWCRWCPAAGACPEQHRVAVELAQISFDPIPAMVEPIAPGLIPVEERLKVMAMFPMIKTWMRDVEKSIGEMLERGESVPGWKLVSKRPVRSWVDPRDTAEWLKAQGFEPEEINEPSVLKSPAQIEKLLGNKKAHKDMIADRVTKTSNGLVMVPNSDPRPAVASLASHSFPALSAGTSDEDE